VRGSSDCILTAEVHSLTRVVDWDSWNPARSLYTA